MLAASRSDEWHPDGTSVCDVISGLSAALDECIHTQQAGMDAFQTYDEFNIPAYRHAIVSAMNRCCVRFDALPVLGNNVRLDVVRRFMTLLFMEQDREITLCQQADGILVIPYEAD